MAEALNELWLPHELLTDDGNRRPLAYLDEYEEEHVDGLSRRVAHEKEDLYYHSLLHKRSSEVMARSPQSTLCNVESCCVKPRLPPHATAPQHLSSDDAWNLLSSQIQTPPNQRVYARMESACGFYPNPSLAQHKLRVSQFCHLKRQQLIKQQLSPAWRSQSRGDYSKAKGCSTHVGFSSLSVSPPPVHKPQPGSGMRAVFLNPRKESSGTGVFLPRQTGSPSEPREKPACSTALLPARVVQALNLDLDELGIHPRLPTHHDLGLARNHKTSSNRPPPTSADARLPPEWTY